MKQLVGYITAGVLEQSATIDLIGAMSDSGMDALELGIPFSDPVADGPVIERAAQIALLKGFKFQSAIEITQAISPSIDTLWMGYFNSFYNRGMENIATLGEQIGLKGLIIPDLPHEEGASYKQVLKDSGVALIDFVAPTDSQERITSLVKASDYFIYLVAYAGITGAGKQEDLSAVIKSIKAQTQTPLYIGFGVDKETAKEKAALVDGVIVGSAFVKILIDEHLSTHEKITRIATLAGEIKSRINE